MKTYLITGKCMWLSRPVTVMRNVTAQDEYTACVKFLEASDYPLEIADVQCINEEAG